MPALDFRRVPFRPRPRERFCCKLLTIEDALFFTYILNCIVGLAALITSVFIFGDPLFMKCVYRIYLPFLFILQMIPITCAITCNGAIGAMICLVIEIQGLVVLMIGSMTHCYIGWFHIYLQV